MNIDKRYIDERDLQDTAYIMYNSAPHLSGDANAYNAKKWRMNTQSFVGHLSSLHDDPFDVDARFDPTNNVHNSDYGNYKSDNYTEAARESTTQFNQLYNVSFSAANIKRNVMEAILQRSHDITFGIMSTDKTNVYSEWYRVINVCCFVKFFSEA